MNDQIRRILSQHEKDIERLNNQRRLWLYASSIVLCGIIFLIFGWEWLTELRSRSIWWVIVSLMLIISVNWWYWTMRVVRIILKYQSIEYELLKNILEDIHAVKLEIKSSRRILDKLR